MPLRSLIVHDSWPRSTLALISPSSVKLAYEERISRPLSVKRERVVFLAMRPLTYQPEARDGRKCHLRPRSGVRLLRRGRVPRVALDVVRRDVRFALDGIELRELALP